MGKGVATNNGLIGLHRHIHQTRNHTACRTNLGGVDVGVDANIVVTLQNHGYLLKRCVACTLANAIDGNFHLTRSVDNATKGIGCGKSEVVVTMG